MSDQSDQMPEEDSVDQSESHSAGEIMDEDVAEAAESDFSDQGCDT
jgi:hypothetical protein